MNKNKEFYDSFHKFSKIQHKLISERNFTYQRIISIFNRHIKRSDKILDLGCGIGVVSMYYGHRSNSVVGVDVSGNAISIGKKSVEFFDLKKFVKFKVLDFPNEFLNETFDKIIFSEVLEHIRNEDKALSAIYKMLKYNGKLIISVPSENSLLHKLGFTKKFDEEVGHLRRYALEYLKSKLEKNGFFVYKIYKTEGLIRNIMFNLRPFGFLVKFMKGPVGKFVNWLDSKTVDFFGESQIIVIACKKR